MQKEKETNYIQNLLCQTKATTTPKLTELKDSSKCSLCHIQDTLRSFQLLNQCICIELTQPKHPDKYAPSIISKKLSALLNQCICIEPLT